MYILTRIIVFLVLALIALGVYVRLAPSYAEDWHDMPNGLEPGDGPGHAVRVVPDDGDTLERLDGIIRDTPRTTVLAGSVEEGMVTYITRSALWGFPDYTTVARQGGQIVLYGRLRFGKSDMGVNAKRLDGWLARL
ncbi:hypothetical protein FIU85_02810 [Roseovarius sp. THAF8]|uniref:DUF1499 domain-containing protein n=1 Tax=Roseovarius sp. THAF8 TaxID=2587846 RepID=UPI001268520A|nr:DUF1499 domain-containing protein [Roseovarius sp. THAF8]QFT96225.1 hypothetical protein FIU85_02810 [Roseovarius sp. THAF8]